MTKNFYVKTHGLGNEYLVLDEDNISFQLTSQAIKRICNINYGLGTDGILLKGSSDKADIKMRTFNPDGSEAEKSGNGLRIFSKYIYDYGFVSSKNFTVETMDGVSHISVEETRHDKAYQIKVDMGKAIFDSKRIPTLFNTKEAISQKIQVKDQKFEVNCVSIGNPHAVILKENLNIEEIKTYGPYIEAYEKFPNKINVQFVKPISRVEAEILIWERGAGFTLASGSSSSAVASILKKKGLIDNQVQINMIGGSLNIKITDDWQVSLVGEVRQICEGTLHKELIEDLDTPMPSADL